MISTIAEKEDSMPKSFLDLLNEARSGTGTGAQLSFSDEQIVNMLAQAFAVAPLFHQTTVVLDNTQIRDLPTTVVEAVPAPGADRVLLVHTFTAIADASAGAYGGALPDDFFILYYGDFGTEASLAVPLSSAFLTGAFVMFGFGAGSAQFTGLASEEVVSVPPALDAIVDTPITIGLFTDAGTQLTDGDSANTLTVSIVYMVYNTATKRFE